MEIGKQIKKYRNIMGYSQEELALKIFVSRQTISNWENEKNYPDVKSLLLLSSIFNTSIDQLVKGDIIEMKEKINEEDVLKLKNQAKIYTVLLIGFILVPTPLVWFLKLKGAIIYAVFATITFYYAYKIEKQKKKFDIKTYKEIVMFMEGKTLTDSEKNQEFGKRPYQIFLLFLISGLLSGLVAIITLYFLKKI